MALILEGQWGLVGRIAGVEMKDDPVRAAYFRSALLIAQAEDDFQCILDRTPS